MRVTRPVPFAGLPRRARGPSDAIERATNRRAEPVRTYWRFKGLVVHGYFTSERVMKDVLHIEIMPGRFDGAAPLATKAASSSSREMHDHA